MKKILLIVLVLVTIVAAVSVFAPFVLQGALRYYLKESGFYQAEGSLTKFGFTQAKFNHVILQKKFSNNNQVIIQIPQINIKYSIGSLLKGDLDGAIVEKLKVKIILGVKTAGNANILLSTIRSLPVDWLQINSVTMEVYNAASARPWFVMQGNVKSQDVANPNKLKIILKFVTNMVDFASNQFNFGSFNLTGGKAKLAGTLTWNDSDKKLAPNINFTAKQLDGNFNSAQFVGLNGSLDINSFTPLQTKLKQRLYIAKIKHNIIVTDVSAVFSLQFTKQNKFGVLIDAVKAKIADGSVYAKDITLKNDNKKYGFILFIKNVDMAKLLAMANQKRLRAKGRLNGSLAMEYSPTGFGVKSGSFVSRNGVVRYLVDKGSSEFKSMDPSAQQVLEILEDFHYQRLAVSMKENANNGQAIVKIRAMGANPDFYANSPVDFNFSITGPLRRMLHSFFVGEDAKQYLLKLNN